MGAFLQNLPPVPPPTHTTEMQCLGAGQLQVSMHKGTATTSTTGEVKINLLSVSYRQSANLQGFSQRDVMGVMMFNGIQNTHSKWEAVQSQPAKPGDQNCGGGRWGTGIPKISDQGLQPHHLQPRPSSGGPFLLLIALTFVPDQD